jgi:hypothetical protein
VKREPHHPGEGRDAARGHALLARQRNSGPVAQAPYQPNVWGRTRSAARVNFGQTRAALCSLSNRRGSRPHAVRLLPDSTPGGRGILARCSAPRISNPPERARRPYSPTAAGWHLAVRTRGGHQAGLQRSRRGILWDALAPACARGSQDCVSANLLICTRARVRTGQPRVVSVGTTRPISRPRAHGAAPGAICTLPTRVVCMFGRHACLACARCAGVSFRLSQGEPPSLNQCPRPGEPRTPWSRDPPPEPASLVHP